MASIDGPRPLWQPAISLLYSVLYCLYFVLAINSVCVCSGRMSASLVPAFLGTYEDIKESIVMYSPFVAGPLQVEGEFALWRQQWINKEEASMVTTATAAVERCSPIIMPNIRQLLLILATHLCFQSRQPKPSEYSQRWNVPRRLHVHTTEDRLEALVMINTHQRLTPDCDSIVTRFAETGVCRVNFVICSCICLLCFVHTLLIDYTID